MPDSPDPVAVHEAVRRRPDQLEAALAIHEYQNTSCRSTARAWLRTPIIPPDDREQATIGIQGFPPEAVFECSLDVPVVLVATNDFSRRARCGIILPKEGPMFRISFLVWLVVLAALNLTVLRTFDSLFTDAEPIILLVGLMPLFDTLLVVLYLAISKRYRFKIRMERGAFLETFGVTLGVILGLATFTSIAATQSILRWIDMALGAASTRLRLIEQSGDYAGPALGAWVGALMSGPLIALALVTALVLSQFKVDITRR